MKFAFETNECAPLEKHSARPCCESSADIKINFVLGYIALLSALALR